MKLEYAKFNLRSKSSFEFKSLYISGAIKRKFLLVLKLILQKNSIFQTDPPPPVAGLAGPGVLSL